MNGHASWDESDVEKNGLPVIVSWCEGGGGGRLAGLADESVTDESGLTSWFWTALTNRMESSCLSFKYSRRIASSFWLCSITSWRCL